MSHFSQLGYYGLRRLVDILSSLVLRVGIRAVDRLMDRGGSSARGGGDTVLPGSGVGSGVGSGAVVGAGSGVVVGGRMSGCNHCLVEIEPHDESPVFGESSLISP